MRLHRLAVNGFKSLVGFDMVPAKLICLIGLNGSGKSTVIQFVDFLAQLVQGRIDDWLEVRGWLPNELCYRNDPNIPIEFIAEFRDSTGDLIVWNGLFDVRSLRCISESIVSAASSIQISPSQCDVRSLGESQVIPLGGIRYQGSVLSFLGEPLVHDLFVRMSKFLCKMRSLEFLSPHSPRKYGVFSNGSGGNPGAEVVGELNRLGPVGRAQIVEQLKPFYPQLEQIRVSSDSTGMLKIDVCENYDGVNLVTEARHVNDGMLRLIAILVELQSDHELLLFDEIENGVNPEIVGFLVQELINAKQQIFVTTHSPLILNYLPDDVAREAVVYLDKNGQGKTYAVRFFDIPSLAKKLRVMGPGEVFADTNLAELHREIDATSGESDRVLPLQR